MAKKLLLMFLLIITLSIVSYVLYDPILTYIKIDKQIENIRNNTGDIFTGNVVNIFSGDNSTQSGQSSKGSITDKERYESYIENNNFRSYHPKNQPITSSTNYNERSKILNDYLTKNNFYFRLNNQINSGYLYIKLKVATNNDIFLYWHNSSDENGYQISGKIRKNKNLIEGDGSEFLFPLNAIPIVTYYKQKQKDYPWLIDLNKNQLQFIGGYVVGFDGNQIEEITIAWE